jgi:integrase
VRYVYMTPKLKGVMARYLGRGGAHGAPLLPTESGRRRTPDSLRKRVFEPLVDHARQLRAERGHPVLPRTMTPHTMRRTFISLWLEADPPAPMPSQTPCCASTPKTCSATEPRSARRLTP